jgi:hypothetical protein
MQTQKNWIHSVKQKMGFKKVFIIIIFSNLFLGCNGSNESLTIKNLQRRNDSLENILSIMNQKYIFDSITIRDIPSYKNSYQKGTEIMGEIVIVGYSNNNQKTNVVLADSIAYAPNIKLYNPDTLIMKNGGFVYFKELQDSLSLKGLINVGNKYGKSHQFLYNTMIKAKK